MWIIFTASGDSASVQHSSRIIEPILHWFFPHLSQHATDVIVYDVRKCAHLTEYALLALLVWRALREAENTRGRPLAASEQNKSGLVAPKGSASGWNRMRAGLSVFAVLLYASTDELHQHFVANRNASVGDVCIDTTGGAIGILLLWFFGRWRKWW